MMMVIISREMYDFFAHNVRRYRRNDVGIIHFAVTTTTGH
jgi:hypothetical protein